MPIQAAYSTAAIMMTTTIAHSVRVNAVLPMDGESEGTPLLQGQGHSRAV
jgi:hypothetical protein